MRPNFFFIYTAVFVNIVGFSIVFPLLPSYAKMFNASDATIGILAASFALAQLFFSPFWGMLSDKFGRKPIIGIGLLGLAISFLVFGLASNLTTLFISRFLQGVFSSATLPAARAYVADLTSKEERVRAMGRIGASLALGVILGPAIGGILAQQSLALPFFGAALVSLLNLVFVMRLLPESLKEKTPNILIHKSFLQIANLWKGLRTSIAPLFLLAFIWSFALSNHQVAVPLLGIERFNLNTGNIGLVFTVMGAVSATTQFLFLTKIASFLGKHFTAAIGLFLMALGFTIMPFLPPAVSLLYLAVAIAGFGSAISRPVITALISEETKQDQGITMGTANAFESFGRLMGPLIGGFLFTFGLATPFIFSGFVIVAVVLFVLTQTRFLRANHSN